MQGVIFKRMELDFWKNFVHVQDELSQQPPYYAASPEERGLMCLKFILQTLKSYKPSPNGNGIKWSKQEKEAFAKLSYKEQRKMIVRKSELKSVLFPYVDVDYEPYKYSDRISDTAKRAYEKAQKILATHKDKDFSSIEPSIQQEVLHNLRVAYKEQHLKAGVELAKYLFNTTKWESYKPQKELYECAKITKELVQEGIPESSYMYYHLYKWARSSTSVAELGLNKEQARECYNHALESVVWEAIDEEAQRIQNNKKLYGAELWLAAAIKYQSPLAFYKAASNYSPNDVFPNTAYCSLILHHACLRCAIALGSDGAIGRLESNYRLTAGDFPRSDLKNNRLRAYAKKSAAQKGLINGLDPYFDEKFPPDVLIDFTSLCDVCTYGSIELNDQKWMGVGWAVKYGYIKDPRTKGSTLESIKKYYLMMWGIIIERNKKITRRSNALDGQDLLACKAYENLQYGLPSARPYIFPKEVLDLEIDFSKGLEEYYKVYKAE